jgi:hypothetical protein
MSKDMVTIKIEVDDDVAQKFEADRLFQKVGASKFFEIAVRFYLKCKTKYDIDFFSDAAYSDPRVREEFEQDMNI